MKGASMRQHESGLKKKGIWLVALKLLTAFIPVIALFFANFLFSTAFAERLADNIIAGKKSYTFSNYNDRKLDRKIVEGQRPVPERSSFQAAPECRFPPRRPATADS